MRGYRPYARRRQFAGGTKVMFHGDLANLQRPRISVHCEHGYVGFYVAYEQPGSDPFVALDVDLTDTRLGDWVLRRALQWDDWRARNRQ